AETAVVVLAAEDPHASLRIMESNATPHEDEDEYVLLDLDGVCGLIDIPPNANYVLTLY
ncbi:hypothetical protein L195_g046019, partial [Trifolium pratense]